MLSYWKKKEILSFVRTWMNLEDMMLCEKSQAEKENPVWSLLYMEFKKSQGRRTRKQVTAGGYRGPRRGDGERLVRDYKHLVVGWLSSGYNAQRRDIS